MPLPLLITFSGTMVAKQAMHKLWDQDLPGPTAADSRSTSDRIMTGEVMETITEQMLRSLAAFQDSNCVSILAPVSGKGAEGDFILWKNQLDAVEKALTDRGVRRPVALDALRPARALLSQREIWQGAGGLAFFLERTTARVVRIPGPIAATTVIAPRFYLKPLMPFAGPGGTYFVLAISQKRLRLIRGDRWRAEEVAVKGMPANMEEALRSHDRDEPLEFHTHPSLGLGRRGAIFHGQGVGIDDHKKDLFRYFRAVDRAIHPVLQGQKAPLLVASVEYEGPIYRQANTYPHLVESAIAGSPDLLSVAELHERASKVVLPLFEEPRHKASALYTQLAGTGRTACNVAEAVTASAAGRFETLFVATDAERWGRYSESDGGVSLHDKTELEDEPLLNLAALKTLKHGGTVFAVPAAEIPGGGPIAGIYWLPNANKKPGAAAAV
jgi:hypothetical protein